MTSLYESRPSLRAVGHSPWAAVLITIAAWAATVSALAWAGLIGLRPAAYFPLGVAATALVATLAFSRIGPLRRAVDAAALRGLTLFHAWRIVPGVAFLVLGGQGVLPEAFTLRAGWGDVLAGVLALAFLPVVWRRPPVWAYLAFHLIGLADLLAAVGTGGGITLAGSDGMRPITVWPLVLVPLVGVPLSAAAHLLAFRLLWRSQPSPVRRGLS